MKFLPLRMTDVRRLEPKTESLAPKAQSLFCLRDCTGVEEIDQIGMAGQRFARVTFDQNADAIYAGNIHRQRFDQRVDGKLFVKNAGTVLVGERGVEVNDGNAGRDQVNAANVSSGSQRMGGARLLVNAQ